MDAIRYQSCFSFLKINNTDSKLKKISYTIIHFPYHLILSNLTIRTQFLYVLHTRSNRTNVSIILYNFIYITSSPATSNNDPNSLTHCLYAQYVQKYFSTCLILRTLWPFCVSLVCYLSLTPLLARNRI